MPLKQQLHIINWTLTLKSLCTQPNTEESRRFSSLQMGLKILEGLPCAVNASDAKHVKHPLSPLLRTWIYVLKETKQSLGVRSRVATSQDQQALYINNKWKNLSLSRWSLSPFLCLPSLSFPVLQSSFVSYFFFLIFVLFILLILDFANVLSCGKPAGANFLLHPLSLFPQFAFSLISLFSMLALCLHCPALEHFLSPF